MSSAGSDADAPSTALVQPDTPSVSHHTMSSGRPSSSTGSVDNENVPPLVRDNSDDEGDPEIDDADYRYGSVRTCRFFASEVHRTLIKNNVAYGKAGTQQAYDRALDLSTLARDMLARRVHHQTCIHCGCTHSRTLHDLNLFRNALEDEMNVASSAGRTPLWHVCVNLNSVLDREFLYHNTNFPLTPIPCDMTHTYMAYSSVLEYPVLGNTGRGVKRIF